MTGRAWTRARATLTGWRRTLAVLVALAVLVVMMGVSSVTPKVPPSDGPYCPGTS